MLQWKLYPLVGEIVDKAVSITYELYNKNTKITCQINNRTYAIEHKEYGPSNIVMQFDDYGTFTLHWRVNGVIAYTHDVIVSEYVNKLIVVSCDFLEANTKHSLWNEMNDDLDNNATAIIHLGDQMYADAEYKKAKKIQDEYEKQGATDIQNTQKMLDDLYYDLYSNRLCDTFRPHHRILSKTSNYFLWDDHEICNDYCFNGVLDINSQLKGDKIAYAALKCYRDYQMSFEVTENRIINDFCWVKKLPGKSPYKNQLMISIERTFEHISVERIINAISELDYKEPIASLILCFASAPLPPPHNLSGDIYTMINGTGKFWDINDTYSLISWLFTWMSTDTSKLSEEKRFSKSLDSGFKQYKRILILGGDLHLGVNGYYTKNNLKIPILISSPITNHPSFDRKLISKGLRGMTTIRDLDLIVTSSKAKRCYGMVDLESFETTIVYSNDKYPKKIYDYLRKMSKF